MRTAVALGSNLDDRLANLRAARAAVINLPGVTPPILSSAIYETDPVDCEPGAARFLNAVIEFDYNGQPSDLLKQLKGVENALGRPSNHQRNVSRRIDIDLLYLGDEKIETEELRLPHPRMHQRKFVLRPLNDIRSELVLPGQIKAVAELLAEIGDSAKVIRTKWDLE